MRRYFVPVKAIINNGKPYPRGTFKRVSFVNGPGWGLANIVRVMRDPNWNGE